MLQNKNAWVFVVFEDVFTDANISSIKRMLGSKLMLIKSTLIKIFLIQHKLATTVRKNFWKMHVFQFFRDIYGLIFPPTPISMLKNVISVLHELGSSK